MVPFHMLHIVSYCAIVTLRRAVFTIFVFKKFHDLEMGSKVTQVHLEWYHSIDCVWFLLVFFSNFVPKMHRF